MKESNPACVYKRGLILLYNKKASVIFTDAFILFLYKLIIAVS